MCEAGGRWQSHQAGRDPRSLRGRWGLDLVDGVSCSWAAAWCPMKPPSLPSQGPASQFTATGSLSSLHSWGDKAEGSFPSIRAAPSSAGRLFHDLYLRQIPEGSARESWVPATANLLPFFPSRVGCGLWPRTWWEGAAGLPLLPALLCIQPAEVGGCREEAGLQLCCPLSAGLCSLLGCTERLSVSPVWPPSPPSHSRHM